MRTKSVIAAIKFGTLRIFKWASMAKDSGYRGWIPAIIVAVSCLSASHVIAQGDSPILIESNQVEFLTGKKLDRRNLQELSFWWKDAELRDRLVAFSEAEKIAVMLDRRIDPSTLMNLGVENRTLEQIFWRVGREAEIGVCRIEDCYYFGPVDTVVVLPIALDTLSRQAKKVRRRSNVKWTIKRAVRTGPIVATKALIEAIADKHGFSVNGLHELPHDLWYEVSLPPMSVIGQMQLMLAGFGKTFEIDSDGKSITIIDFPKIESAKREFSVSQRPENSKQLAEQFPDLKISFRSKAVVATGSPLQLALLEAKLIEQVDSLTGKEERFTLNTQSDRLTILRTIAQTSKLELDLGSIDPEALADRIDLNVDKVSQAELLFETLKGTRFLAQVQDGKIMISQDDATPQNRN